MEKFLPACLAAGLIGLSVSSASAALSSADREFAMKAASGGLAEVQAVQLAEQRPTSAQIKQFAQRMIADHIAEYRTAADRQAGEYRIAVAADRQGCRRGAEAAWAQWWGV
jgi:predicted outer membrane protein